MDGSNRDAAAAGQMGPALAVHTAARRYLIERRSFWMETYARLPNGGRSADGYIYLDQAKDVFPRYNVLNAIRVMVERLDPDNLPPEDEVAVFLRRAAFDANDVMTDPPNGEIETRAMDDERLAFSAWLDEAAVGDLAPEPLPYRRAISDHEVQIWWNRVESRWPIEHGGWWKPIVQLAESNEALVLNAGCFWHDHDAGPATLAVRAALEWSGVDRVIELREYGPGYEVGVEWLMPTYNGAEGIFTSGDSDWLIFASHEGVAALGGTIVVPFKSSWPDWRAARWTGR